MATIPEEEVASVKDSIASRLPSHEQNLGTKASGSCGIPVWSNMGQFRVYGQKVGNDAEEVEKRCSCHLTRKKEDVDGSYGGKFVAAQENTLPLLKIWYRWWANLRECRGPPQGVLHPRLLGSVT